MQNLHAGSSGDVVKYIGPNTEHAKDGDHFVIIGFIDSEASLGKLDGNMDKETIMDNLICDLDVPEHYYKYFIIVEKGE